jgi:hypothetical protein
MDVQRAAEALAKEDYVWVAHRRRSPHTAAYLWKQTAAALAAEFAPAADELAALEAHQAERARVERECQQGGRRATVEGLKAQIRARGATCPTGATRGGLLDVLAALPPAAEHTEAFAERPDAYEGPAADLVDEFAAVAPSSDRATDTKKCEECFELRADLAADAADPELDADQRATVERAAAAETQRLFIYAGPGAGKTTTLVHCARRICADAPTARVLILVYNRAADEVLNKRLKALRVSIINNNEADNDIVAGAAVMTFDKFAHRVGVAHCDASVLFDGEASCAAAGADSYAAAMERAVATLRARAGWQANGICRWDVVIVDEAQDLRSAHAEIINSLAPRGGAARLIVAGDPRQELYQGATWYSEVWASSTEDERAVLRYNHRSGSRIVDIINAFSYANFPTLHCEQIPTRAEPGRVWVEEVPAPPTLPEKRLHLIGAGDPWAIAVGKRVGELLAECTPRTAYAVAPVTVEKFCWDSAQCAARQHLNSKRPDEFLSVGHCVDPANSAYAAATSAKIKGTERARAIVYAIDSDYSFSVDECALIRRVFVALSRARDELVIVRRFRGGCLLGKIMEPVYRELGDDKPTRPPQAPFEDRRLPTIMVAGVSESTSGLCVHPAIPVAVERSDNAPTLNLGPAHGDSDFLGIYAEALVLAAAGAPRPARVRVKAEADRDRRGLMHEKGECILRVAPATVARISELVRWIAENASKRTRARVEPASNNKPRGVWRENGECIVRVAPATVARISALVADIVEAGPNRIRIVSEENKDQRWALYDEDAHECIIQVAPANVAAFSDVVRKITTAVFASDSSSGAYLYTKMVYSGLCGTEWTVSDRLLERVSEHQAQADKVAQWLASVVLRKPLAIFRSGVSGTFPVHCDRPNGRITGSVDYEVDLLSADGTPVEIKYVKTLSDAHRRQTAIYAATCNTHRALLVNLREGCYEWIAAAPRAIVEMTARAAMALRYGRQRACGPLAAWTISLPPALRKACLVSVDVVRAEQVMLEIGAVAFDPETWQVLSVFSELADGVSVCDAPADNSDSRTRLAWGDQARRADELIARFREWLEKLPVRRTNVRWGGLIEPAETCFDLNDELYAPWLELRDKACQKATELAGVAKQVIPGLVFEPCAAFDCAVAAGVAKQVIPGLVFEPCAAFDCAVAAASVLAALVKAGGVL